MTTELSTAMERFQRCIEDRDQVAAETVLDDDYELILVTPSRAIVPKARWIGTLPDYHVHSYAVEEQIIAEDGDVAVVHQRVHMDATVVGEDRSGVFVLADIWRKRADGWKIWRRCSAPVSAGSMPAKLIDDNA